MNSKRLRGTAQGRAVAAQAALAMLAVGVVGLAGAHNPERPHLPSSFSGVLNDYTPFAPTVAGGPYEMHGKWSLHVSEERNTAAFSAEMTMETADFANLDPNHDPAKLGPHTHHISVTDGVLHNDPTDPINWKTRCPTFKPPVTDGFVITGPAFITGNGGNPPFGNPAQVTICILGGTQNPSITAPQAFVEFSNFTMMFDPESLASKHFGTQAINGVAARCERPWIHESSECHVSILD